jgi:hypothetical protein
MKPWWLSSVSQVFSGMLERRRASGEDREGLDLLVVISVVGYLVSEVAPFPPRNARKDALDYSGCGRLAESRPAQQSPYAAPPIQ